MMCGICGVAYTDPARSPDEPILRRMRDVMHHRGPDEAGMLAAPGVGLGHRRLSIIDLSSGQQPLGNEDGRIQVVFNGEIYNFPELRERLIAQGHRFASRSDTEVIVHLYEEVGGDFASQLEGMFAIALWDSNQRRLWLARDHLGKKPVFYYQDGEKLVFASELKSILEHPGVPATVDREALIDYLHLGYVAAPRTIFEGIRKLPPGHIACWAGGSWHQAPRPFWTVPEPVERPWDWSEACDAFREGFLRAVKRRLISDVPLGAFLSGGLDSSAVVAAMCQVSGEPIRTFTIGFGEEAHDESPDARRLANHLGTRHVELRAEPPTIDLLPDIVWYMDEPMADSSALPTYLVCRLAREHVTVALSGDGGDELLGGYRRYFPDERDQRFLRIPAPLRSAVGTVAGYGPEWMPAKRYLQYIGQDESSRYLRRVSLASTNLVRRLLQPDLARVLDGYDPYGESRAWEQALGTDDPVSRFTYLDYRGYMPNDILVKVDRMSMASSLEVRCPFVDHHLIEMVSTFPAAFRATQEERKRVLRQVIGPWLPPETLGKAKHGFSVPVSSWFRREAAGLLEETLFDGSARCRPWFREEVMREIAAEHRSGRADHSPLLWALACLELWLRRVAPSASLP